MIKDGKFVSTEFPQYKVNWGMLDSEDKAKIKESMTPWVIGIFVAFGAYGIWSITMNIFMNL